MNRFAPLFALGLALGIIHPATANATTVKEALNALEAQADKDLESVPYAITREALNQAGRTFPGVPSHVIEAARKGLTAQQVGKSTLWIETVGDMVVFTAYLSVYWHEGPSTISTSRKDRLKHMVDYVGALQRYGLIYQHNQDGIDTAVPSFGSCHGADMFGGLNPDEIPDVYQACQRFMVGDTVFPDESETKEQRDAKLLSRLMAKYGKDGVLSRGHFTRELTRNAESVEKMAQTSPGTTGRIIYNTTTDTYELDSGHLVHASGSIGFDGRAKITVNPYAGRIKGVKVDLRYSNGEPLAPSAFGNMASVLALTNGFVPTPLGMFQTFEVSLPDDLKPGQILIYGSAVDETGTVIVKDELVGRFEYKKLLSPEAFKAPRGHYAD